MVYVAVIGLVCGMGLIAFVLKKRGERGSVSISMR